MQTRLIPLLTAFSILLAASQARAQCADWQVGPLDNGGAANGTDGPIRAMYPFDPDGAGPLPVMLVAAGQFTSIQGVSASNIAARDPATGMWQPLGSGTDDVVYALTVYNGELIAGGSFTHAGGVGTNHVARWNGSSWQTLPYGGNPDGVNNLVTSLAVYNGKLIVGGAFTMAGGAVFAHDIASWDPVSSWQTLGVGVGCNVLNCGGQVMCLTTWGGDLIAGGSFTYAGNQPASYTARWDGTSWHAMGGDKNGDVTCLQPFNGELIAGGRFSQVDQYPGSHVDASNIARWNGSAWQALGSGTDSDVLSLSVYNGTLIVGGGFDHAGGIAVNDIAGWNGSSWTALGAGIQGSFDYVESMMVYNAELVVGGSFSFAGGQPANSMARWNGFEWVPFGGGSAGIVFAMTNYIGRVVAGGDFHQNTNVGAAAHAIAGWDGVSLSAYGTGMDAAVIALKSFKYPGLFGDSELIAGGLFTHAGGVAANRIARWDQDPLIAFPPPAWQAMGSGFNSGVYAIERYNSATYAGGPFTFSTSTVNHIARWNETTKLWEAVGTGMNGAVRALKTFGSYLYAGGDFTTAGGVSTGGLARWDGTSWSQVGGVFNGTVYALEVHNGLLVIGGLYPGINSSPNLAYYTGSFYSTFATGGTNGAVRSLRSTGTRLYIGGTFSTAGGVSASNVAYWDGFWHEVAGGANDVVYALAAFNGEIHAGGVFTAVDNGALASPRWAKFTPTGVPWFVSQPFSQTIQVGDNVSFTAQPAPGYPGVSFQWNRNGVPLLDGLTPGGSTLSGATTPTLTLTSAVFADNGGYQMVLMSPCGNDSSVVATLDFTGVTGVAPPGPTGATVFETAGPNPTRGPSQLAFSLAVEAQTRFRVYDLAGRLVRVIDMGRLPAGPHQGTWDARDSNGQRVHAGLYFVSLEVDGQRLGDKRLTVLH
jgi:hypothetical protein